MNILGSNFFPYENSANTDRDLGNTKESQRKREREKRKKRNVLTFIDGISAFTCKPHAKNLISIQLNTYIALYHFQSFLMSIV